MKKIISFAICMIFAVSLNAQSVLKTKSISIFKDGKSFVIKEGTVETKDKEYMLDKIPNALMGTFWFSGKSSYIKQVVSSQQQVDEPIERKANSFSDLLYANKDQEITITTADGKIYSGVVEDFDLPEEINSYLQLKEAELAEYYVSAGSSYRIFNPANQIFSFKMNNKWISLSPMEIKSIEFTKKPNYIVKSKIKVKKPVIKIEFEKGGNQGLNIMYLQNGISWTPAYLMTLLSDTEANLKLQAEVINDIEDIKDTEINFVVGVPNFLYANQPATLNMWTQIANALASRSGYNNKYSNALVAGQVYSESVVADEMGVPSFNPNNEAEENEDLYLYNIKNINLEKGSRAHYTLFESKVKIKHLYECILPANNNSSRYHDEEDDDSYTFDVKHNNVYHSIEILNDTKNPFTTGPVMIVNAVNEKPVAQDLLKYTGTGLTSSIKLTQSSDIRVDNKEKVTKMSSGYTKIDGSNYKLATVEGEVTIINSKNKDINFSLGKTIIGKLNTVSEKYSDSSRIKGNAINPSESFKVKMAVKGKETKKVKYTYQIYVR